MSKDRKGNRFKEVFANLMAGLLALCLFMTVPVAVVAIVVGSYKKDKIYEVIEEEYGYKKVAFYYDDEEAVVTTLSDEVKTVGLLHYKRATIFYDNEEQRNARITEVDSGTYPEDLYFNKEMFEVEE